MGSDLNAEGPDTLDRSAHGQFIDFALRDVAAPKDEPIRQQLEMRQGRLHFHRAKYFPPGG